MKIDTLQKALTYLKDKGFEDITNFTHSKDGSVYNIIECKNMKLFIPTETNITTQPKVEKLVIEKVEL